MEFFTFPYPRSFWSGMHRTKTVAFLVSYEDWIDLIKINPFTSNTMECEISWYKESLGGILY